MAEVCALQAVYSVLKEAEHRSTFYIPYWNLPLAMQLVPRQRRFTKNLRVSRISVHPADCPDVQREMWTCCQTPALPGKIGLQKGRECLQGALL